MRSRPHYRSPIMGAVARGADDVAKTPVETCRAGTPAATAPQCRSRRRYRRSDSRDDSWRDGRYRLRLTACDRARVACWMAQLRSRCPSAWPLDEQNLRVKVRALSGTALNGKKPDRKRPVDGLHDRGRFVNHRHCPRTSRAPRGRPPITKTFEPASSSSASPRCPSQGHDGRASPRSPWVELVGDLLGVLRCCDKPRPCQPLTCDNRRSCVLDRTTPYRQGRAAPRLFSERRAGPHSERRLPSDGVHRATRSPCPRLRRASRR